MSDRRDRPGLVHSFAFRLGLAFAIVALAASALTAGLVTAAFGSPFNRYLQQQRAAQTDQITALVAHAYRGDGRWNEDMLSSVGPLLGTGTLRLEDPYGNVIWRWPPASTEPKPGGTSHGHHPDPHGGASSTPSPSPSPSGGGSNGGWHEGDNWTHDRWSGSGSTSTWNGGSRPMATSSAAAAGTLGPAQRIPIEVDGRTVGYAVVELPAMSRQPDAAAFRSALVIRLLLGGLVAAMLSLGLGVLFAFRAARPVRQVQGAARALAAGEGAAPAAIDRIDEFGEVDRALRSMAGSIDEQERLRQGFAAQVAHELRTPLTILRSQIEGLRVGVMAPSPETFDSLQEEVLRMSRLVADLQILGSADAAGFTLERSSVDLRDLVDESVREFAGLFEGSEIRVETRLEPAHAWVDRVRVGQIVSNLLSNALKFTPPGGLVRVGLHNDDPWAVLTVSDSGPGIPSDELPLVFDRFFRGRGSQCGGSGIGLTVVRELAGAHGGEVEVSSEPGAGATFTVRLPEHAGRAPAQLPTAPALSAARS